MGRFCSKHKVVAVDDSDQGDVAEEKAVTATKSMFSLKTAIGKGSYGMVWKAFKKTNNAEYAIKVMEKTMIYNYRSVDCIINELEILRVLRFPFIVNIHYAFQEKGELFMVQRFA